MQNAWHQAFSYSCISPTNHETNGLDERTNRTVKQRISKLTTEDADGRDDVLDDVAFFHRNTKAKLHKIHTVLRTSYSHAARGTDGSYFVLH